MVKLTNKITQKHTVISFHLFFVTSCIAHNK